MPESGGKILVVAVDDDPMAHVVLEGLLVR